jgi:transposase
MFARVKKSGPYEYLQIVENKKVKGKVKQSVITTLGRLDKLQEKARVDTLIASLSRFSEQTLLLLSGKSEVSADAKKVGPVLIFERLWEETGIAKALKGRLQDRHFHFDVERAVFLTVLHRLMASGSDRHCELWHTGYLIEGVEDLMLHHFYRAMAFLGEELGDQEGATPFSPRCTKDLIEEDLFLAHRNLFSSLDLVFFDTTSIYFEGQGGSHIGRKGHNKDHRPDCNQMVVGAVLDQDGKPICCEMWPGNTTDVKALLPVVERFRKRFSVGSACFVADRGMISAATMAELEAKQIPYILGARMRKVKEVKEEVLSRAGRYREVRAEGVRSQDPSPLKVKEVRVGSNRYVVCFNPAQARKDARDREAIVESLKDQLKRGAKSLVGNKGYRKYLKISKDSAQIDVKKIKYEARFDGKWVLKTNTDLTAEQVALKYKELWQVEQVFRDMKTVLETRPVFHQRDDTIRGHVFCSFLALVLRKELQQRLAQRGHQFEWAQIKKDLKELQLLELEENGTRMVIRTECKGCCGKVFQAVGVAPPPRIQPIMATA